MNLRPLWPAALLHRNPPIHKPPNARRFGSTDDVFSRAQQSLDQATEAQQEAIDNPEQSREEKQALDAQLAQAAEDVDTAKAATEQKLRELEEGDN